MKANIPKTTSLILLALNIMATPAVSSSLTALHYQYDYGDAVKRQPYVSQHVICDRCPGQPKLDPFKEMPKLGVKNLPQKASLVQQESTSGTGLKHSAPGTTSIQLQELPQHTVMFGFDSYRINRTEDLGIEHFAGRLRASDSVVVEGHACTIGPPAYNKKLSRKRAEAVAGKLEKLGIPVSKVKSMGDSDPTGEGNKADRRVELTTERHP